MDIFALTCTVWLKQFSILRKKRIRRNDIRRHLQLVFLMIIVVVPSNSLFSGDKIIIAHRGASGYLPEHTLAAATLAYAQGADYIEQDVVMTKDDRVIVLHDIHLETTTNVAEVFPGRARDDGRFYAIDFTLAEIRQLKAVERINRKTGQPVFPGRFPANQSRFFVPTLNEEIELIRGLNKVFNKNVGIYVEIKAPAWHQEEGKDLTRKTLDILYEYGYNDAQSTCFIQCFDPATLKRLRFELKTALPLIQLIGENSWNLSSADYTVLQTSEGLKEIAAYANGIGPWLKHIVTGVDADNQPQISDLVTNAQSLDLLVHPYTFRADQLPKHISSYEAFVRLFAFRIGVDGLFTDYVDLTRAAFND